MSRLKWRLVLGGIVSVAGLWIVGNATEFAVRPLSSIFSAAQAKNPCSPGKGKRDNPCNPCAAKAKRDNPCNPGSARRAAVNRDNPCNPCAAKTKRDNPCNPCAAKAKRDNPCNPGSARRAAVNGDNPCNPCNPRRAALNSDNPCNPCNPCAAGQRKKGPARKIGWGQDYRTFDKVNDLELSLDHGNRLVVSYVSPKSSARIFRRNAQRARSNRKTGYRDYPVGTVIVEESWDRDPAGKKEDVGLLFFMKKEKSDTDPSGGKWRYGYTRSDFSVLGEGSKGKVGYCAQCHSDAKGRDYVFTRDTRR